MGRVFLSILLLFNMGCSSRTVTNLLSDNRVIQPLKRVALVIGNKNYAYKRLENTINDAKAMKKVLEKLNFEVIDDYDISAKRFTELLEEFQNKLDSNTIAFFYFSGHANTLAPSSIESFLLMFNDKQETLVSIYKLYKSLNQGDARVNIICLDSCRSYDKNPTNTKNKKGVSRGGRVNILKNKELQVKIEKHTLVNPPYNTLTVYATGLNEPAEDVSLIDPKHSPFSRALIKHIDDEEISFVEVLRRVRKEMNQELNGLQRNSEYGDLSEYIYLNPKKANRPSTVSF
jgi:uncharacterized caspase-like protein